MQGKVCTITLVYRVFVCMAVFSPKLDIQGYFHPVLYICFIPSN